MSGRRLQAVGLDAHHVREEVVVQAGLGVSAVPSLALFQFRREGLARHYLKINGTWQDHLLFSRLSGDSG